MFSRLQTPAVGHERGDQEAVELHRVPTAYAPNPRAIIRAWLDCTLRRRVPALALDRARSAASARAVRPPRTARSVLVLYASTRLLPAAVEVDRALREGICAASCATDRSSCTPSSSTCRGSAATRSCGRSRAIFARSTRSSARRDPGGRAATRSSCSCGTARSSSPNPGRLHRLHQGAGRSRSSRCPRTSSASRSSTTPAGPSSKRCAGIRRRATWPSSRARARSGHRAGEPDARRARAASPTAWRSSTSRAFPPPRSRSALAEVRPDSDRVHPRLVRRRREAHVRAARSRRDRIAAAARAPVYGPYSTFIGTGIVAGSVPSFEGMGTPGRRDRRSGSGRRSASSRSRCPTRRRPSFELDWRQAQRWGIREADIPPGAVIRFKEPTFWEAYHDLAIAAIAVTLIQAALITALSSSGVRGRRTAARSARASGGWVSPRARPG